MPHHVDNAFELGHIIRFRRKQAGLSRADLSNLASVSSTVIYELEHGKRTVQLNVVLNILIALNLRLTVDGPLMDKYSRDTVKGSSDQLNTHTDEKANK